MYSYKIPSRAHPHLHKKTEIRFWEFESNRKYVQEINGSSTGLGEDACLGILIQH